MADYKGGFDTTGDILLNFDITRTSKYTESFVIPATKKYRLKYVPKDLSVESLGFTVVNSKDPQANYIGIDYAPDNEYQAASGIIYFNVGDVGRLISVTYVPVGSRIDANDLNPALQWVHAYRNALYTKVELATSGAARVNWDNIINAPAIVTPDKSGFMSFTDKRALDTIDPTKKPFGSVLIGPDSVSPSAWGGPLELGIEGNVWPKFLGSKVIFTLDPATKGLVDDKTLAALAGTTGVPSSTNKFVTEEDPRIKNPGIPIHKHPIQDVNSLSGALDSKADKGHKHTTADITGLDGTLGSFAAAGHKHTIVDTTGLQAALDDKAPAIHRHTDLEQQFAAKANVGHNHSTANIIGLYDYVEGMITNNKPDTPAVDVRGLSGDLANLDHIVYDDILSGFNSRINTTDAGSVDIAAGDAYVAGLRTTYTGGTLSVLAAGNPVKTVGAASSVGPVVLGNYPLTTPNTYTIVVNKINGNPGLIMDLSVTITNGDGSKVVPVTYGSEDNTKTIEERMVQLEPGFGISFTMVDGGQYVLGDTWTVTIGSNCNTHFYIDGKANTIVKVATPSNVTTPPARADSIPVATASVVNSKATAITDRRGTITGTVRLKDVKGITKPAGDSSKSLATTEFVKQATAAAVASAITQPAGDSSNKIATTEFVTRATAAAAAATGVTVITHTGNISAGDSIAIPAGISMSNATNVTIKVTAEGGVTWGFRCVYLAENDTERTYNFVYRPDTNAILCTGNNGVIQEVKIYVTGGN